MSTNLSLSTIRVNITPDFPTFQAGYAARKYNAEGVHDPIYLIVYFFKMGPKKLVFCSFDLCTLDEDVVNEFKNIAKEEFDINPDDLLLSATHTHQAPVISKNPIFMGDPIPYRKFVMEKFCIALKDVQRNFVPVEIYAINGNSKIGINRRGFKKKNDPRGLLGKASYEVIKAPNPFNPWDRTANMFLFLKRAKRDERDTKRLIPIGLIFKMTAHPTILGSNNYLISAEWPGATRNYIKKGIFNNYFSIKNFPEFENNPNFHPLFLQGTSGDVKPSIIADPPLSDSIYAKNSGSKYTENKFKFREGTFDDVDEMGKIAAEEIMQMVKSANFKSATFSKGCEINSPIFNSKLYYIDIPLKKPPKISYFEDIVQNKDSDRVMKAWANRIIKIYKEKGTIPSKIHWPFHFVTFGKDALLIGIGGEPVSEVTNIIQNIFSDSQFKITCVFGSTGEYHTYLPTKTIIKEGGYESHRVIRWTSQASSISLSIDKILKQKLCEIKKEIQKSLSN